MKLISGNSTAQRPNRNSRKINHFTVTASRIKNSELSVSSSSPRLVVTYPKDWHEAEQCQTRLAVGVQVEAEITIENPTQAVITSKLAFGLTSITPDAEIKVNTGQSN